MFKLTETETSFYLKALNDKIEEFIPELEKSATYFQQTNQKKPEALAHFANLSKKILQINHNFGDICHHAEYLEKWVNHLRRIAIGSWNQLLKLFKQSLRSLAKQQKQKIRFSRDSGLDHLEVD